MFYNALIMKSWFIDCKILTQKLGFCIPDIPGTVHQYKG